MLSLGLVAELRQRQAVDQLHDEERLAGRPSGRRRAPGRCWDGPSSPGLAAPARSAASTALESMPVLISLSATLRLTGSVCLATQTSPMPPSPIFSRSVYRPAMTIPASSVGRSSAGPGGGSLGGFRRVVERGRTRGLDRGGIHGPAQFRRWLVEDVAGLLVGEPGAPRRPPGVRAARRTPGPGRRHAPREIGITLPGTGFLRSWPHLGQGNFGSILNATKGVAGVRVFSDFLVRIPGLPSRDGARPARKPSSGRPFWREMPRISAA